MDLRQALAELFGRRLEEVAVGNGMDDLLELLGDALLDHGDEVVFADPSFMLYEDVCMRRDARAVMIPLLPDFGHDLDAMAAAVTPRTKLVIVCNPNNPTGNYIPAAEIAAFVDKVPEDVLVVIDEAYNEFVSADDREDTLKLQAERPNVCLFRTFSKAYGLAGLRMAYGLCPEVVRGALDKVRQPFNVNRLAQVAALEALKHQDQILERRRMVIEMREYLRGRAREHGSRRGPQPDQLRPRLHRGPQRAPGEGLRGPDGHGRHRPRRQRPRLSRVGAGQHGHARRDGLLPRPPALTGAGREHRTRRERMT